MNNESEQGCPILLPKASKKSRPFLICLIEFIDTTGGRDKFYRLIQYFAKFITPFVASIKSLESLKIFMEGIGSGCGLVRAFLRIGRYISIMRNAINRAIDTKNWKDPIFILKNLSDVALSLYFLLDHVGLLNKVKAINVKPETIKAFDKLANLAWLTENFSSLTFQLIDIYKIHENIIKVKANIKSITDTNSEAYLNYNSALDKMREEYGKKYLDILRCITDIPVLIHFLTSDKVIPTWMCGFFGILSSWVGCQQKWI